MKKLYSLLLTGGLVLLAAGLVLDQYYAYLVNPWTRDGQVAAQVIEIAPRVSGPIVRLSVTDNQQVKKGELLFRIDQSKFRLELEAAEANLKTAENEFTELQKDVEVAQEMVNIARSKVNDAKSVVAKAQALYDDSTIEFNRKTKLLESGVIAQKEFDESRTQHEVNDAELKNFKIKLNQAIYNQKIAEENLNKAKAARGNPGEGNARLRLAQANLKLARLNLDYTDVKAPADGYISNLQLRAGSQLVADRPAVALIDSSSYWVYGFFQEDMVTAISPGDDAVVTLMSYPDTPLNGRVESVGWGIARDNGSQGNNLLVNVNPTFEWIRLAQRIPVRVILDAVPENIRLRVGTTASVMIKTERSAE